MVAGSDTDGAALRRARERVAELSVPDGAYAVACIDTGVQPTPVSGSTFETYEHAERARAAAVDYREALRALDPSLPKYDLAVCEPAGAVLGFASVRETTTGRRENGLPRSKRTVTLTGDGHDEWLRVENAPVVDLVGPDALLDDEVVERQLETFEHEP